MVGAAVEGMPWLGTFHSVAARMLRSHAELVGLKPNFSIRDTDDQLRLLKQIINAANIPAKLDLAIEPVPTQVIPHDSPAMFFQVPGVIRPSIVGLRENGGETER